ncbi:nucleotidyl transferase AbiEii/AbiGii toxin family protein [Nocardiopsis sp. Huas11]|uniref:nucleotidyl transferase AbiEii/AbiGii toxin family protein n=1 Tax=Nocardiopsis sp. Huas11 TaxID=2183912 RepID=UPI0021029727|nr:nucleotidyl transferase AbiEii/AbiGii toxin family protein [Nocardiopsis sp. Huas11]
MTRTKHKDGFVLKGGILLAVYGVRRPTKDVDAEAIRATVTPEAITQVIRDVADVRVPDGLVFDLDTMRVQEIRDQADYPGLRMRVTTHIGS